MLYKRWSNPAGYTRSMLPLFGRTRKAVANVPLEAVDDEWFVPSDQELYGIQGKMRLDNDKVESDPVKNVNITTEMTFDTAQNFDNTTESVKNFNISTDTVDINDLEVSETVADNLIVDDTTFQSMNNESECTFSTDDAFSIMNNETTIISCPGANSSFPTSDAFKTVLERLVDLERKFEALNNKVTIMEQEAQKGIRRDSKPSIFGSDFIEFMQEVMKSGLDYQQRVLGKFMDELDGLFNIDLTNFDPFKE